MIKGKHLLSNHETNKSTAFSAAERENLNLTGLLPYAIETLEQQINRAYLQFNRIAENIDKNLFLNQLHDTNTTLFYALISHHFQEMLPIVYTPTIAEAVTSFSRNYMRPQGLIISWPQRHLTDEILSRYAGNYIPVAVVTDGEGVLGIGDQGIGGLAIARGKLMVYTICGALNPFNNLAIQLDAGTNNQELLEDPLYLGWRSNRISQTEYDEFIEIFVKSFKKHLPQTLLHWEDFGRDNARRFLDRYRKAHPSFNDDIQGTGAVAVSAILSGMSRSGISSENHRICIFGAGTAGTGIADQLCNAVAAKENIAAAEVRKRMYLIDKNGLLLDSQADLLSFQKPYARCKQELMGWRHADPDNISLEEVITNARPTVLIGCSTRTGAFSEKLLKEIYSSCPKPVIMPLSNPTAKAETTPAIILSATDGNALIATGSPFNKVEYAGSKRQISQCNNALIFPGLGLGMLISKAGTLTDNMLLAASDALSRFEIPENEPNVVLPEISIALKVSEKVALAVATQAAKDGAAEVKSEPDLIAELAAITWKPEYSASTAR